MKQPKPQNSVTRRIADDMMSGPDYTERLPLIEDDALSALEALFPPRTKGRRESEDEHLRYAGMVELVGQLRARYDNHIADRDDYDTDGTEPVSLDGAEKAS
jgi:hypothetical protein